MGLEIFDHYECDGQMKIKDLFPKSLTHLSLFSGIGGLDLAAEWAGFQSVGQCEFAEYPTKILKQHWPDVPRWRDIRTLTGESFYERTGLCTVDVISGGFPCQPFSTAGKRRGEEDDRYLWPEMVRVITELRPTWVVGENVAGIINMALDRVLSDLEGQGYATRTFLIPACGVNAPHQRYRTAIVAYADRLGQLYRKNEVKPTERRKSAQCESIRCREDVSHTDLLGLQAERTKQQTTGTSRDCEDVPYTDSSRYRRPETGESNHDIPWDDTTSESSRRAKQDEPVSGRKVVSDFHGTGCQKLYLSEIANAARLIDWGVDKGTVCDTSGQGLQDGLRKTVGEPGTKPEPERPDSRKGEPDGNRQWAVEPSVGRVAHGIPDRVDRIKCLGNAVVPQQFYPIFRAISDIEHGNQY